jgi:molybdenum cofactor cytidylyltransferase
LLIVTGRYDAEIKRAADNGLFIGAELVYNPDWQAGMSSAIRLGCELLAADCDQLLVLLSDQILVSTEELSTLINSTESAGIACAGFGDTVGPPAVFRRSYYPDLLSLDAENGAKKLLTNNNHHVCVIPMQSAGWDIDSPDDLEKLEDVSSYIFGN